MYVIDRIIYISISTLGDSVPQDNIMSPLKITSAITHKVCIETA